MPRHKRASNDGKEVPSSVAVSSVNTDDMKSPVPTTRAKRSGNKEKCEVEDVFTPVQRKGRRPQETEPSERLLSANNDVTGNCDKRTKRNGNPPAASKPKKRRFSSGRHSGNCQNNRLVDAEDIINKHKTGSKNNDLTQNASSVSAGRYKTGSNDLTQDACSVSARLADQCDEVAMGCSNSAGTVEENVSMENISTPGRGRKKGVRERRTQSGIGTRVRKDRLNKRSNDPKLKDYQRLHAVASSLQLEDMGTFSPDTASPLSQPKRKDFKPSFVLPSLDDDECSQSDDRSQPNNQADQSCAQISNEISSNIRSEDSLSQNIEKQRGRRKSNTAIAKENKPSTGLPTDSQHIAHKSSLKSIPLSATRNNFVAEDDDVIQPELHTSSGKTINTAGNSETATSSSHIKSRVFKKNRIFCDQCDFSVSSIAVMVFHQKSHSHNLLAEKGNGIGDVRDARRKKGEKSTPPTKRSGSLKGNNRRRSLPLPYPVLTPPRFTKRKASFDPNVDEDATESSYSPYKCELNTNENGCLTPSDSDEDFPDPFGSSQESPINKGDLVWVKYHGSPFWPAVVMQVYQKKGRVSKLTIVFIGNMGVRNSDPKGTRPWYKKIGIAYKSNIVVPFGTRNCELKNEAYKSEFSNALEQSIFTAEDYMHKKAFDKSTDHEEYFAEDIGTAEERYLQKLEAEGALNEETLRRVIPEGPSISGSEPDAEDEEEEIELEEEEVQEESESLCEPTEGDAKRQQWRKEQSLKIVQKMTSKGCLDYLDRVYRGKVANERHNNYMSKTTKKERLALAISHGYGPILDEDWDTMIQEMRRYTDRKYGEGKVSLSRYLLDVWIPEGIIYAIQRVRKISREKAENVFKNGIRLTKKEKEHSSRMLIKNAKNIPQEDRERYEAKNRRDLEQLFPGLLNAHN